MEFLLKEAVLAVSLVTSPDPDPNQLLCLSRNIYHEARGETRQGQAAVGYVTLNRVKSRGYPSTICEVVEQDKQFSWYSDGKSDRPKDWDAFNASLKMALAVLSGTVQDRSHGATHYFAQDTVTPSWASALATRAIIGGHTFKAKCDNTQPAPECAPLPPRKP